MKKKIYHNLYLSVDYDNIKSKDGTIIGAQFYLIGTMPVLISFTGEEKELAKVKVREPIECDDPELRTLMGKKATEEKRERYQPIISTLTDRIEKAIKIHLKKKKWAGKKIDNISIIKMN